MQEEKTIVCESKKDISLTILVYGLSTFILYLIAVEWVSFYSTIWEAIGTTMALLLVIFILLWFFKGTRYYLNQEHLSYKSGPLRGKIEISKIHRLVVGKTLWIGLKPATAKEGIIIKYGKYGTIYISPSSNTLFVQEILKRNKEIRVEYLADNISV